MVLVLVLSPFLLSSKNNVDGFIMSRPWILPYCSYSHRGISTSGSTLDTTSYPYRATYLESQPKKRRRRKQPDQDESKVTSSNVVEGGISSTKEDVATSKSDKVEVEEDIDEGEEEENNEQGEQETATKVGEDKVPVFKFSREEALAFGELFSLFPFFSQVILLVATVYVLVHVQCSSPITVLLTCDYFFGLPY